MSVTKPEIETHSAPQGVEITDAMVDKFVSKILDWLIQRVDMWEGRLASGIGKLETRVSLLTWSYRDKIDWFYRDDGKRWYHIGHENSASLPRISEERRLDWSLTPWSSWS